MVGWDSSAADDFSSGHSSENLGLRTELEHGMAAWLVFILHTWSGAFWYWQLQTEQ